MKHCISVPHWEVVRVDGRDTECTVSVQTLWLVFGNKSTQVRVVEMLNVLENKYYFSEYFTDMFFIIIFILLAMYITK